jgi:hypothetical protein
MRTWKSRVFYFTAAICLAVVTVSILLRRPAREDVVLTMPFDEVEFKTVSGPEHREYTALVTIRYDRDKKIEAWLDQATLPAFLESAEQTLRAMKTLKFKLKDFSMVVVNPVNDEQFEGLNKLRQEYGMGMMMRITIPSKD